MLHIHVLCLKPSFVDLTREQRHQARDQARSVWSQRRHNIARFGPQAGVLTQAEELRRAGRRGVHHLVREPAPEAVFPGRGVQLLLRQQGGESVEDGLVRADEPRLAVGGHVIGEEGPVPALASFVVTSCTRRMASALPLPCWEGRMGGRCRIGRVVEWRGGRWYTSRVQVLRAPLPLPLSV